MAKNLTYNFTINGNPYTLVLTDVGHPKKETLTINGEICKDFPKPTWKDKFIGNARIVNIEGKEVHVVKMGNTTELAIDGTYIDSGLPYIPPTGVPAWGWIFVVLSALLAGLGGAIGGGLGAVSSIFCLRIITNTKEPNTAKKVAICIGIIIIAWIFMLALAYLIMLLRGNTL